MADIDVKNKSSNPSSEDNKGVARREEGERGVARRREWDPFGFPSPAEFFNNPFSMMRRMSEEMDRTFGRFFEQSGQGRGRASWHPALEVTERNGKLQVSAELPGLNPEDVKVEITNDSLVIHGERKYEHESGQGEAYHSERRYGQFYREIALPEGANAEQAEAQFRNGVLEVSIPMSQQSSRRREIPISAGGTSSSTTKQTAESSSSAATAGSGGGSSGTGSSTSKSK